MSLITQSVQVVDTGVSIIMTLGGDLIWSVVIGLGSIVALLSGLFGM